MKIKYNIINDGYITNTIDINDYNFSLTDNYEIVYINSYKK